MRHRTLVTTAAVWLVGFGVLRLSLLAPEECPAISKDDAVASATAAADWLAAGQQPDGRYLYEYNRDRRAAEDGYNLVRHAGVTMSLYQLAAAGADDGLDAADVGLEYMLDRLRAAGDGRALVERGATIARVGASALMVAALLDRRAATGDEGYDDELLALGRFLAGQVEPSGRVSADYDLTAGAPTGQTSATPPARPRGRWRASTRRSRRRRTLVRRPRVAEYLATERDDAEAVAPQPWPDQWAAYLLAELAPTGLSAAQAAYARELAERFSLLVRTESQKDGWPTPFVDAHARGAGLGVWVEGVGSLARVAEVDPRLADLSPALDERLACGAGLLAARQVDDGPVQEVGAWFRDDVTRMDDQQHALRGCSRPRA